MRKILPIFLINLLLFYQIVFYSQINFVYIPAAYAQEIQPPAPLPTYESTLIPKPEPTSTSTPEPNVTSMPTPNPTITPTPSPVPQPTPIPDKSKKTENSVIRLTSSEKKIKKGSTYVEGQVLVKFKENKINLKQSNGISKAREFAQNKNLNLEKTIEKSNVAVLKTRGESIKNAIDRLKSDSNVQYAEPNFIRAPFAITSNDTYRNELWGLDNFGQTVNGAVGASDADIDAPESWGLSEGNSSVVVAVIDTGVYYNHSDLQANMWDGTNCKDENGDVIAGGCNYGYDYEDNDNTPLPASSSHGTHVAGTIAGVKNNSKGIIGVAPGVKIMALKFGLDVASEVRAIDFAIQNGAKIINASYGGLYYSQTEYDAINRFRSSGGIFIAAAGNSGVNNDSGTHSYPSDYNLDNIISVAATDQNDNLASFSNYGATSVDIAAPGVNILSTVADISSSQILNETFESVAPPLLPTDWTKTNDWGTYDIGGAWGKVLYGDVVNVPYKDDVAVNSTATSPTFNLNGSSKTTISFWARCDTEYSTTSWTDYMALETSADGVTFSELVRWDEAELDLRYNGDTSDAGTAVYYFQDLTIPQSQLTANFKFRFRWATNGNLITGSIGDGCLVDDIEINKYSLGSNELYSYYNGTSMATPHVAGLAALVWSHNLSQNYSQVKNMIVNTGDTKASLNGKTVSGKRVNANNALLTVNGPVITGLANDATPTKSKTWNWDSSDVNDQFRYAIDQSATWTPTGAYGSVKTATQSAGNGTYYLHVQAKNSSGVESQVTTVSAILDNTAPSILTYTLDNTAISPQASIGYKDSVTIDWLFSERVSANVDILNSEGTKVKDLYTSSGVTNPQPKTWDGKNNTAAFVPNGIYTIKIVITDDAGNSITDTSKTITVNNSPLNLNPIGNKSVNQGNELTFTAQATDDEGGTLTFSLTGAPVGAAINSSTGVFNWTPAEGGSYTFTVSVSSTTGSSVSEQITVAVFPPPPSSYQQGIKLNDNVGSPSFISVPHNNSFNLSGNDLTIEAWVKPEPPVARLGNAEQSMIVTKTTGTNFAYHLGYASRKTADGSVEYYFFFGTGEKSNNCASEHNIANWQWTKVSPAEANTWKHVAAVVRGGKRYLWEDGKFRAHNLSPRTQFCDNTEPLQIGARKQPNGSQDRLFRGQIDEVRISKTARYIGRKFTPPVGPFALDANTIALYRFDNNANDATFNSNNGQVIGIPSFLNR